MMIGLNKNRRSVRTVKDNGRDLIQFDQNVTAFAENSTYGNKKTELFLMERVTTNPDFVARI
jgi:hypothetical protein